MKNARGIHEKDLSWSEFEQIFKKRYRSKRYFHDKVKEFNELKMGPMIGDEYTSKFLELLRYMPYLKEDKAQIKRFTSGLPMEFKYIIEFHEARSLEEAT